MMSMKENEMIACLKEYLDDKRIAHSISTKETAVKLAKRFGANQEDAKVAGIFHDIAKQMPKEKKLEVCMQYGIPVDEIMHENPELLHGFIGAEMIKRIYHIENTDVLNAVRYHTTGRRGMSLLEKVVYLADLIEPGRDFYAVDEIRDVASVDLNGAVLMASKNVMRFVLRHDLPMHPLTLDAYNDMLRLTKR